MSEIKSYTIISNDEGTDWDYFEMDGGNWHLRDDVAPIIKRNKELEAELARLREQKPSQIPAELVEWINTVELVDLDKHDYSDMILISQRNIDRTFVMVQLEKLGGKS